MFLHYLRKVLETKRDSHNFTRIPRAASVRSQKDAKLIVASVRVVVDFE